MCAICGCSDTGVKHEHEHMHAHEHGHMHAHAHEHTHAHEHGHTHEHGHEHGHSHTHSHEPVEARTIRLEKEILDKNQRIAQEARAWFGGRGILALNLISSPGAGKTTLLERTLTDLGRDLPISVIEGDQETSRDADRIRQAGGRAVQINTGRGCHLDASMVRRCLPELGPAARSIVMIENVGNLVCPALFDLGERAKVVMVSVTEGDDKPLKYPHAFRASDLLILSKIDLLPYVPFDLERFLGFAREVNPRLSIFQVSATRGDGLAALYGWLRAEAEGAARGSA